MRFASYAWCDGGPRVPDADVWEVEAPLPVEVFAVGDRVVVHADLAPAPGARNGRGVVEATAVCTRVPRGWAGNGDVARIAFDHGPRAWVFLETLRRAPDDAYERVTVDPAGAFGAVTARSAPERARALHAIAPRSGGDTLISAGAFGVAIASAAVLMYGLVRRLPIEQAAAIAAHLLASWAREPGDELAYTCPVELVLGGITMCVAERRCAVDDPLRSVVTTLPPARATWLGVATTTWRTRLAYLAAAAARTPPALPDWVLAGYPPGPDDASSLGLSGAFVPPSEIDRLRP